MSALLGQGEDFERALRAARELRLPQGLVIEGASGVGKSRAARILAQALLCAGDEACAHRVLTGNHVDLHLCELPEDKQFIPIERVRLLQEELEHMPVEGRARVAILDPADRLNEQGQNALLKTLEEPGPETYLLLVTSRPEALLETVRSRSGRLRIRPLDDDSLRRGLGPDTGLDPQILDEVVAHSGGSLGLARRLCEEDCRTLDGELAAFLARPVTAEAARAKALLQGYSGRTQVEGRARDVLMLLRGRLRDQLRRSLAVDGDGGYLAGPAERWASAIDVLLAAETDLALGISPAQVLDAALLELVDRLAGNPA